MTYISFSIPGDPVAKGRPRFTRSGHAYTPAKTRTYEEIIRLHATKAMRGKKMLTGAVEMNINAFFPIPKSFSKEKREQAISGELKHTKKPDWDNAGKIASDGCNRIVYNDDAQVCASHVYKWYSEFPRVEISIAEI